MSKLIKNRIVVKVGTSTLTHEGGGLNLRSFDRLARALLDIQGMGFEVILVSSGAIAVGQKKLMMAERPRELRYKQAAAAVGQGELMHLYGKFFGEYGGTAAQILLTGDDIDLPEKKANLQNTFEALLEMKIIPIVNENDSVSFSEIESTEHKIFGDNDTLSAIVAVLVGARTLVLLSDVDGLYDADPRIDPNAKLIPVVREIDGLLRQKAGGVGTARGTGGMITKLGAAELCMAAGIDMIITNGGAPERLYSIAEGRPAGTLFLGREKV